MAAAAAVAATAAGGNKKNFQRLPAHMSDHNLNCVLPLLKVHTQPATTRPDNSPTETSTSSCSATRSPTRQRYSRRSTFGVQKCVPLPLRLQSFSWAVRPTSGMTGNNLVHSPKKERLPCPRSRRSLSPSRLGLPCMWRPVRNCLVKVLHLPLRSLR
jgi:hypothetical protein